MSEDRYAATGGRHQPDGATTRIPLPQQPASAGHVVGKAHPAAPAPRVGYVPTRTNRVRDGLAVALLVLALLLPWSIEFGLGVPGSSWLVFVGVFVVTLLALAAALAPHVGPFRLAAPQADVARTSRIRLWLCVPYLVCVVAFVGFHLAQTIHFGGTGAVPPGVGPGMSVGVAGALLAAQQPITSITLEDNGFRRWFTAARYIGIASIVLAAWAVVFNLFWRLRYLFATNVDFGGRDAAVIITTLLYGAVAMTALVIGSLWLAQKTAAGRLATTALGVSAAIAGVLVWVCGVGRDVDAFHGIAENTSTAAVGYEGYLAWAAAAAIVAPTTLYAVFLIKPPTLAVYRGAALKCLALIAFWSFAAAGLRVVDYVIALSLDLPRAIYDSVALTGFNLFSGCIAVWLKRQLSKGGLTSTVIAAFSGVLFVFTAAQLVLGVALAPRYAEPVPRSPDAIFGNDVAQQITSTFDVVIVGLSLAILVAALVTGPLAGYILRRREIRAAAPTAATPSAAQTQPPVPSRPAIARPPQKTVPKIVRIKEDSTSLIDAPAPAAPTQQVPVATNELPAATTALRIQRPPPPSASDATTALRIQRRPSSPPSDATQHLPTASEKANSERPTVPAKKPFAAGDPPEAPASQPIPEADEHKPDKGDG